MHNWHSLIDRSRSRFDDLARRAKVESNVTTGDILATGWVTNGQPVGEEFFDETAGYLRDTLGLTGQEDVLEVGTNAGLLLTKLKPYARTLTGTDISAESLARIADPDVRTAVAEAIRQPFPDNCFDAVFCQGVYQLFPDLPYAEMATRELLRLVRPGGRVVLGLLYNGWLESDRSKVDGVIVQRVIPAWKNALYATARAVKRTVRRVPKVPASHRLSIDPAFFLPLARETGCAVSFPLQVTEQRAYAAFLKFRYSVLLVKHTPNGRDTS